MAIPARFQRLVATIRYELNQTGQVLTLRNPVARIPDREQEWDILEESFNEWSVLAGPLGSNTIASEWSERMPEGNVGMGRIGYYFVVGDYLATKETQALIDGRVHQVSTVKGQLLIGKTPLVQEITITL